MVKVLRMAFVIIVCLAIIFGSIVFACNEHQGQGALAGGDKVYATGTVYADVGPYAEVKFNGADRLTLTGAANTPSNYGTISFTVETNCPIKGAFEGTVLKKPKNDGSNNFWTLATYYKINNSNTWIPATLSQNAEISNIPIGGAGIYNELFSFYARTGAISAQEYGTYTANVTLTISQL